MFSKGSSTGTSQICLPVRKSTARRFFAVRISTSPPTTKGCTAGTVRTSWSRGDWVNWSTRAST